VSEDAESHLPDQVVVIIIIINISLLHSHVNLEWCDKIKLSNLQVVVLADKGALSIGTLRFYLTECIYLLVLESQLPHKIVNLLFTITN